MIALWLAGSFAIAGCTAYIAAESARARRCWDLEQSMRGLVLWCFGASLVLALVAAVAS